MTDAELEQCRHDGALLRSLVSRKVKLARKGKVWKGCCPFHTEKTPSFTVYNDGHFHCYGCDTHGTSFDFVMQDERVDFHAAVERVAAEKGMAKPAEANGNGVDHDEMWLPIVPTPADAPEPPTDLISGRYNPSFEYVTSDGRRSHYQRRVQKADKKDFYPLTYGSLTKNGRTVTGWHSKVPPQPWLLYRLDRLTTADPDSTVMVVEGEGKCQAAERMFPDFVCTSWMGGAGSVDKSEWSVLKRFREARIIYFADADRPREDGKPHGCFIATPAFLKLFPQATQVDTTGLADIKDGYDAKDLEQDVLDGRCEDPEAWLKARLPTPEQPLSDAPKSRILSGRDFLATFVPPDYIIDGIIQRGRLYACTSITGHGKTAVWLYLACMVAAHRYIGTIETTGGEVVILAGENAEDLCGRMHAMCQEYHLDPAMLPHVLPANFPLTAEDAETLRGEIDAIAGDKAMIVIDTGPAFFPGDNDNDNVQMGDYGRIQRTLARCRGRPAVIALTHPVKNADRSSLIPRGGGAYVNELDGNLALWADAPGESTTMHWQGKFRGADFAPLPFSLRQVMLNDLQDAKGRPITTIIAEVQSQDAAERTKAQSLSDENAVLYWLNERPGIAIRAIARAAGWISDNDLPLTSKVHRCLNTLKLDKLVRHYRGKWVITDAGLVELKAKT